MDQPQQNVQQSLAVGQGYSSSQLQSKPQQQVSIQMSQASPAYVAQYVPPQGQSNSGPSPCCGCMPLKTACYVIGILGIVISILLAILLCLMMFFPLVIGSGYNRKSDLETSLIAIDIQHAENIIVVIIVIQVIYIIFNIILVCGASSESAGLCIAWIIAAMISLLLKLIGALFVSGVVLIECLLHLWFIVIVVYYVKELNGKRPRGQAQAFIPPTQVPSMIQPAVAYSNPSVGPPPPYSQTQSAALMKQNPTGPGQTYPSGQNY